jgi:O-antigen/teichoic acid export membrane protein
MNSESAREPLSEKIAVRFGATLAANILRAGLSFASGVLIARGLGASGYGDLNFLLGSFAAISQLFEMGTSFAFYTFISQRRRGKAFVAIYLGWMVLQFAATVLVVGLVLPASMIEYIWVGHERGIIFLALGASFLMTQAWGMVNQLGEAVRKTVIIQAASVTQAVLHLGLVAAAVYWNWLTVHAVMWLLVGEYMLLAGVFGPKLIRENLADKRDGSDSPRAVASEFVAYCKPLVIYGWVGFLYAFADRWLLQEFGGAEQQGSFAIGQQFANIGLLATASILRVFWKEIAESQDHQRSQELFTSISRSLFFAAAWISCLLIPYSHEILSWTVGPGYEFAWLCLAVMFLYPVHQALGQIQGTYFLARSETRSYARIGLVMMAVSIPVTYFLLAPGSLVGLGLGAVGLAAKMVALQIIGVNVQAYVIARSNGWVFDYWYQGLVLLLLVILGFVSKWIASTVLSMVHPGISLVSEMLLGGAVYAVSSMILLYRMPSLAGLTQGEIKWAMNGTLRRLRPTTV